MAENILLVWAWATALMIGFAALVIGVIAVMILVVFHDAKKERSLRE